MAGVGGGGPVAQHVPTTSLNPSVAPGHGNLAPSAHATHGLESAPTTHVPSSTELGANTHLPHGLEAGSNANLLHGPELGLDPNLALQHVVGGFSIVPALVVVGSAGVLSWGGPDPAALPGPPLAPGVQLNVLDQVGDRVFVECPDGARTWVAAADVGREPPERT